MTKKILFLLSFLIFFFILSTKVFAIDRGYFDTGVKTWQDREVYFTMYDNWLNQMKATQYWNDNYYKVVFQESNSNNGRRVYRAWFISKIDPNLNLGDNICPFYFEIGTSNAPR